MPGFLLSFLLAVVISPLVIRWYRAHGWVDHPDKQRHVKTTHTESVPRGGGVVIFLSILLPASVILHLDSYLLAILVGALLLALVGMLDDIRDLDPRIRILTGLVAALIVVSSGIGISYISNPLGAGVIMLDFWKIPVDLFGRVRQIWVIPDLFAVFFILWNMNSVNWSKGVDGQLPGFVSVSLIVIGILSQRFIDDPTTFNTSQLAFITAGAFAGLLVWNWYPQHIMPGYGAGSLAGYFLAVLAILSGAKLATVFMVLAIPTTDALFTVARRVAAGKSPLWGDRGHLHHKLLDVFGWSKPAIAGFYMAASLALGLISLYLSTFGKLIALVVTGILVVSVMIWIKVLSIEHLEAQKKARRKK